MTIKRCLDNAVAQNTSEEPPVPAGHIRLYRGVGKNLGTQGTTAFFSTDRSKAAIYGRVHYVDVPQTKEGMKGLAQGHGGPDEFVTDRQDLLKALKPLPEESPSIVTPPEAGELEGLHRQLALELGDTGAQAELAKRLEAEGFHKKRVALLTEKKKRELTVAALTHKNARGEFDPAEFLTGVLEHFGIEGARIRDSVEARRKAIRGMALARMNDLLFEFRRTAVLGRRLNPARMQNVVRELHGVDTGDAAARGLARAFRAVAEDLRRRFNALGGAIGRLEDWGLPQSHDMRALLNAGYQAWHDYILPRLDPARMRNPLTGAPMTRADVEASLPHVWESITTEGWNTRQPTMQPPGRGMLANQHADHRFLVFRDADAWLEYQREFGRPDVFDTMMGYVSVMSRDIAMMQVLGPNPRAMLTYLQSLVQQEAAFQQSGRPARFPTRSPGTGLMFQGETWASQYAAHAVKRSNEMYDWMRNTTTTPILAWPAHLVETLRNVNVAAKLLSATLSAVTDTGFQAMARRFAGLPVANLLGDVVRSFRQADKRDAAAAGLIAESMVAGIGEHARYVGDLAGAEWSRYVGERGMHLSGLTPLTEAERRAFGMAFMRETAVRAHQDFNALPAAFREMFQRYGLEARDWDVMRQAQLHQPRPGATFLRPQEIAALDVHTAERYLGMVLQETEFAVPSDSVRSRTALVIDRPGTFWGTASRSFAQFKSFGALVFMLQAGRITRDVIGGHAARGASYAAGLLIWTSLLGGLAMQLKAISQGKDPRKVNDPKFWGAAILQGGGLGIFGDFLFADVARHGRSFMETMGGPILGMADDVRKFVLRTPQDIIAGEKTTAGRDVVDLLKKYTPGSTLWYTRLAWERVVLDQLQQLLDPNAHAAFRRREQHLDRKFGQRYWWRPGTTTPQRAPDLRALAKQH